MSSAPAGRDVELLRALADRIEQHDPGAFNNLGVLYFSKGLLSDAVDAFLRALALDPRMRTAGRNLEIAASEPGACDAQLAALDARLAEDSHDTDAQRQRARLLRLIGRHTDAIRALDALIAEDPDDANALFERGLIEQRAGDLRRAQRWLERAVTAAPADHVPRLHLAEVLYHRGQNEQSLDALDALIEIAPLTAEAHLLRGFVLGDMGHHEAGLASARRASEINPALQAAQPDLSLDAVGAAASASTSVHGVLGIEPGGGLARYSLGLAFRQRGYFDEGRREFERALEQGEDARLVRHAIAELDLIAGRHAEARVAYEALLAERDEQPRHWNEYGVALHQGGDLEGAADSYRRALRVDPRYAMAYNNLGVALADAGEASTAREALARAAELDTALVCARLNLARWHAAHRDPLAALGILRELVAFHATNADAWHEMGLVLGDLHRPADARDAFVRAIELRADHAEARYALAEVLNVLGDTDGALRETQHALGLSPVRMQSRLTVAIDLQAECPEAVGTLDLLSLGGGSPLAGYTVDDMIVADLLPEAAAQLALPEALRQELECDAADAFATRGLHGEALERYERVRAALDERTDAGIEHQACWRRAALGEARSHCLLGHGHRALPLLRTIGSETPRDGETLALFACAAASAAAQGDATVDAARTAMLRVLRLEVPSAALMHFTGDAAVSIGDESLALAFYRRALALDPTRPSPRVAIARLLRERGDLLAARLELVAALAVVPSLSAAILELARVHRDAKRPADALRVLTRHLTEQPTDIDGLILLAETLIALDRDDDARVAVARVLRHAPDESGALWFDGVLHSRQGRERDALARWRRIESAAAPDEYERSAADALRRAASDAPVSLAS